MSYTVVRVADTHNISKERGWPGDMHQLKDPLGAEQIALTYRRMPAGVGAKGGYGHRHGEQEEIIYVISGKVRVKVDDDVVDLERGMAIRISPGATQGTHNEGPEDAEILIISNRLDGGDFERVSGFWPE